MAVKLPFIHITVKIDSPNKWTLKAAESVLAQETVILGKGQFVLKPLKLFPTAQPSTRPTYGYDISLWKSCEGVQDGNDCRDITHRRDNIDCFFGS